MAWRFRVLNKRVLLGGQFQVGVGYFDDLDPATILANNTFTFVPGTTRTQAITEIRSIGQNIRDCALSSQINVGDEAVL